MITLSVNDIIKVTGGKVHLPENTALPESIGQVVIDTRKINQDAFFIAFKGDHVDGHDYLSVAQENGAVLALVEKKQSAPVPQIIVSSCTKALKQLAMVARALFTGMVIAITGSSGKTSTKEMLVSILREKSAVCFTEGNQNNELGLPLTLINFTHNSDFAVVEMGARKEGDIRDLMALATPDVSVVTNIGQAHIGCFGSQDAIAQAKSDIYACLSTGGKAVLNRDDAFYSFLQARCPENSRSLTYSMASRKADVFISKLVSNNRGSSFTLHYKGCQQLIVLSQPGAHHVLNALCAASCALASGMDDLLSISKGLSRFQSVEGRNKAYSGFWGGILIDDSYNANPASVKTAIDLLSLYPERKILVLGDMLELGENALALHKEVITYAIDKGLDRVLLLGPLSSAAAESFKKNTEAFLKKDVLIKRLKDMLKENDVLLLKGSRALAMDTLITPLLAEVD